MKARNIHCLLKTFFEALHENDHSCPGSHFLASAPLVCVQKTDKKSRFGKVKTLLMDNEQEMADGWCNQQEVLLGYLQNGSYHRLRMWLKERNHSDSA